jgi:hypothetical protein
MKPHDMDDVNEPISDGAASAAAALRDKLADIMIAGYEAEFDPDEAEQAGAFVEDALSAQDAAESSVDAIDGSVAASGDEKEPS